MPAAVGRDLAGPRLRAGGPREVGRIEALAAVAVDKAAQVTPRSPGQALGAGTVRSWKILPFDAIVVSVVMVGVVVAFVGVWLMAGLSEPMRVCRVGPY